MGDDTELELMAGKLRLALKPSIGGSISAFDWTDGTSSRPILRKSPRPIQQSLDCCCFPLVPFVNRIRGGCFQFGGRVIQLKPNMVGDPSPLHGQGWLNPWSVDAAGNGKIDLVYRHDAAEWPWRYEARQEFVLDENGYVATLTCRNLSPDPMPCGLGQHPYFPCSAGTRIQTAVTEAWTIDKNVLPVAKVPAEGRYDLSDRLICAQDLDNGFAGWGGTVLMTDPAWPYELRLSSSDASFFQLYSPTTGGIFVAEPVTHANAALNEAEPDWAALGIRILEQNEEMGLRVRLDVIPL